MTDDTKKRIEITSGPLEGQTVETSSTEADTAIAEGWARDPAGVQVATRPAPTEEQQRELLDKATAGAARIQGSAKIDPKSPGQQERTQQQPSSGQQQTRDMHSDQSAESGYPTRGNKPK